MTCHYAAFMWSSAFSLLTASGLVQLDNAVALVTAASSS